MPLEKFWSKIICDSSPTAYSEADRKLSVSPVQRIDSLNLSNQWPCSVFDGFSLTVCVILFEMGVFRSWLPNVGISIIRRALNT